MWAERYTNRCLVRQLLCLYPFPHVSHFNSPPLSLLLSPLRSCDPSLARRDLALVLNVSISGKASNEGPSAIALPYFASYAPCPNPEPLGRLAGNGLLEPITDFPPRLLKWLHDSKILPEGSRPIAAIAAAWLAADADVDFLRVTRCAGLMAPTERLWECVLDCNLYELAADEATARRLWEEEVRFKTVS